MTLLSSPSRYAANSVVISACALSTLRWHPTPTPLHPQPAPQLYILYERELWLKQQYIKDKTGADLQPLGVPAHKRYMMAGPLLFLASCCIAETAALLLGRQYKR